MLKLFMSILSRWKNFVIECVNIHVYFQSNQPTEEDIFWRNLMKNSIANIKAGEGIEPPWVTFPYSDPDYGWSQGNQQGYHEKIWLPFYYSLNRGQRIAYFDKWNAPEEWREIYLDERQLARKVVPLQSESI